VRAALYQGWLFWARKEHFCWISHSSGKLLCGIMRLLSPILTIAAPSRAVRVLVVARKPA